MKKLLVLVAFAIISLVVNAQNINDGSYEHFMDVMIEFGSITAKKPIIPLVSVDDNLLDYIYDSNGDKIKFCSRSGLINYFIKMGWTFVQVVTKGNTEMLYFKKIVKSPQDAKNGILFKDDIKK